VVRRPPSLLPFEGNAGEPGPGLFPAVSGLWGKPTNNNNVKSYAISPQIIANEPNGSPVLARPRAAGTAIFALTGKVKNNCLVRCPWASHWARSSLTSAEHAQG